MDESFKKKLGKVKLLALDFDGVMTTGHVYVDQEGREMVRSSRRDGMGIGIMQKNGIEAVVISTEVNPVVAKRCEKLKMPCYQGVGKTEGKAEVLKRIAKEKGFLQEEVAYVGDDVNDLGALDFAGVKITVADGHEDVKKISDFVTTRKGGEHAVREICDAILRAHEKEIRWQ